MDGNTILLHLRKAHQLLSFAAKEGAQVGQDGGRHQRIDKATAALLALQLVIDQLEEQNEMSET